MGRRLASYIALPAAERRILLRAFLWLPLTAALLRLAGLDAARATAEPVAGGGQVPARRIAELLGIAARHGLASGNCLSQSLTLYRLLVTNGWPAQLRIGARRSAAGLEAHAWVEHAGQPLNDTSDVGERFPPFPALPAELPRLV